MDAETKKALLALPDGMLIALYEEWSEENYASGHYSTEGASTAWLRDALEDMGMTWLKRISEPLEKDYERETCGRLRAALEAADD